MSSIPVTPSDTSDLLYLVDRPFDNVHHNTCNIGHDGVDPFLAQLFVLQPNLPNMYGGSQQRSTSNPRAYAAPDMGAVGGDRREDAGQGVYDSGYPNYQQSGYAGMQNVNYQYGAQGMGMQGYSTNSPANASRRVSGGKPAASPPASAPVAGANPSPGSRYYAQQGTPDPNVAAQTPYQPTSAPAQVGSHQQTPAQPQTAHPYGGGYYNYYDQHNQHNPQGQWSSHYQSSFAQPSSRQPAAAAASTPQTAVPSDGRAAQTAAQGYDYSQYHQGYGAHDRSTSAPHGAQPWQQQQQQQQQPTPTSSTNGRYSMSGQSGAAAQQNWQGYPHHVSQSMHPQHMGGMVPGYGGWQQQQQQQQAQQQQWQQQGYYPPITPHTAGQSTGTTPPTHATKKEKNDYEGLGKRPVDSGTEDEVEHEAGKKGKKGKKGAAASVEPEEKPVPKPPAKSHLHPPRQAQSMWQLFFTDELNKAKAAAAVGDSPGGTPHHSKLNVAQIAKDAGIAYANLTPDQKAHYTRKVQESKDQYAKDLAAWQATLTPEDIRVENAFRAQQRKEGKSRKGNLKDPNAPKKPLSAYFLFLKGIREDDALRARVWGEESETTKQSVLAAERWRSLTDEEKKPFLQQAEKDKQEYEAARKIYEEDAAARARGEDVPTRSYPEPAVEVPKPVIKDVQPGDIVGTEQPLLTSTPKPELGEAGMKSEIGNSVFDHFSTPQPSSDAVTGGETADAVASGMDMEFGGFEGLGDLDMGFQVADGSAAPAEQDWGQIGDLMGGEADDNKATGTQTESAVPAPASAEPIETDEVSVAPPIDEATRETEAEAPQQSFPVDELKVRDFAQAAEGELAVPPPDEEAPVKLGEAEISADASGVPTEEVSEQTETLAPTVEDAAPEEGTAPASVEQAEQADASEPAADVPADPQPQPAEDLYNDQIANDDSAVGAMAEDASESTAGGLADLMNPTASHDANVITETAAPDVPTEPTTSPAHDASIEAGVSESVAEPIPAADGV